MNTKICSKCKQEKPIKDFGLCNHHKDKLKPRCKECTRKYRKDNDKYYIEFRHRQRTNPEYVNNPQPWFYKQVINSAKKRGIQFNLSYSEFIDSFVPTCCLSGASLKLTKTLDQSSGNQNASLDRIDSSKGYNMRNIQWVDKNINYAKRELSNREFIEMCRLVTKNN